MKNMNKALILMLVLVLTLVCGVGSVALAAVEGSVSELVLLDTYANATVTMTDSAGKAYPEGYQFKDGDDIRFRIDFMPTASDFFTGGQVNTESSIYKQKYQDFYNEKYQSVYDEVYAHEYQAQKDATYQWWYNWYKASNWSDADAANWANYWVTYDGNTINRMKAQAEEQAESETHKLADAYASEQAAKYAMEGETDLQHAIREAYYQSTTYKTQDANGDTVTATVDTPRLPQIDENTEFTIPFSDVKYLTLSGVPTSKETANTATDNGVEVFKWWVDAENGCIRLTFTEEALKSTKTINSMYIAVEGNLNLNQAQDEDEIHFDVATDDFDLPLANNFGVSKSAQLVYNRDTKKYEAQYTVTVTLDRDQNLAEKPLSVVDVHGDNIGEPKPDSIKVTTTSGDDVTVKREHQPGSKTNEFIFQSNDNVLKKGTYTITYTADIPGGDKLDNDDGASFNSGDGSLRKNTATVYENGVSTEKKAEAGVQYTPLGDKVRLDKGQSNVSNKVNYNGIYTENVNGETVYYIDYYLDVKLKTEASEFTVTDGGSDMLSHVAEGPTVQYVQDGWDWVNEGQFTTANVNVSYTDEDGKRTFKVVPNGSDALAEGTYRLKYRMKLDKAAVEEALSTGKDVTVGNTAATVTVDGRSVNKSDTLNVTVPTYKDTTKSASNITLEDGTVLTKWTVTFQWNFHQEGSAKVTDTLTNGKYYIDADHPFIINSNWTDIIKLTDSTQTAGGLTLNDTSFTYELGKSGNGSEKTDSQYTITYYTQADAPAEGATDPVVMSNGFGVDYNGDGVTDDDVSANAPGDEPDEPDQPDQPQNMNAYKNGDITEVDKTNRKVTIEWTVTVDLQNVPYVELTKWDITDVIPANMQSIMQLSNTVDPVVTLVKTDNSTVNLVKDTHYTLTRTDNYTQTVSLNMEAVRGAADTCRQVKVVFTAEGTYTVGDQDTNTTFSNTAKNNYAYGEFEQEGTADGNVDYQNKVSKKYATLSQDIYHSGNHSYGWDSKDGTTDYVYTLELRDSAFVNRGETTKVTIVDTLPTITLVDGSNKVIPLFDYVPGSIKASTTKWDNEYYGRFITPISVSTSESGFAAEFEIPADWPSDVVYVYYNCSVTDEYRANVKGDQYLQQGWYGPVVNKASATWNGNTQNVSSSDSVGITDDRLSKDAKLVGPSNDKAYKVTYTIKINPTGADLVANSDTMTLTDKFSKGGSQVTYNRASFSVVDGNGNKLTRAASASDSTYLLTFADDGSSFEITVPDGKALTITYDVVPTIEAGEKIDGLRNEVSLTGVTKTKEVNGFVVSLPTEGVDTTLKEGERGVKINKEETGSGLLLEDAQFTLYTVNADGERIETGKTVTSDKVGLAMFHIEGTDLDAVYAVMETMAPEGYTASNEVWYFYFMSRDAEDNEKEIPEATQMIIDKVSAKVMKPDELTYEFTAHNDKLDYLPVPVTLPLTKTVTNNTGWDMDADKTFNFVLTFDSAKDADGNTKTSGYEITDGAESVTYAKDKTDAAVVADAFASTFTETGEYIFKVTETAGENDDYITYDDTVYYVKYVVTEPASGAESNALTYVCTIYNNETMGTANETEAVDFVNIYESTSITVTKAWIGAEPADKTITLTLCKLVNGEPVALDPQPAVVVSEDKLTYTWEDMPTKETDGTVITYCVIEASVPGYVVSYLDDKDYALDGETITNTQETTTVSATKAWLNADGTTTVPVDAKVVLGLYNGGEEPLYTVELDGAADETVPTAAGGYESTAWVATFVNLPKYQADGVTEIDYTVKETTSFTGYIVSYPNDQDYALDGETITNTLEVTEVSVTKVWEGGTPDDADLTNNLKLYIRTVDSEGQEVFTLVDGTVPTRNGEVYTWSNLLKYDKQGNPIVYVVKESEVPAGYTVSYESLNIGEDEGQEVAKDFALNRETITNTLQKTEVTFAFSKWIRNYGGGKLPVRDYVFTIEPLGTYDDTMLAFKGDYPVDEDFTVTVKGDVAETDITTTFDLTVWKAGTYEFKITETYDKAPDGWEFSTSEIVVKIVVENQADGSLTAVVTYNDMYMAPEFMNTYWGVTDFYANKQWTKYNGEENLSLKLYYRLLQGLNEDGSYIYSPWMEYTNQYTVELVKPDRAELGETVSWRINISDLPMFIDNMEAEYGLAEAGVSGEYTVTYMDNAGNLITEDSNGLQVVPEGGVITNTLKQGEAMLYFNKELRLSDVTTLPEEGYTFTFSLTPDENTPDTYTLVDDAPTPEETIIITPVEENGKVVSYTLEKTLTSSEATNTLQLWSYLKLTFTAPGTYIFTLQEIAPETIPEGWYYDTTPYTFKFVVTDGEDKLQVERQDESDNPVIRNKLMTEKVDIFKYWKDSGYEADRPNKAELPGYLYLRYSTDDGKTWTEYGKVTDLQNVTVDIKEWDDSLWRVSINNLPDYIGGKDVQWSIVEKLPEGSPYETAYGYGSDFDPSAGLTGTDSNNTTIFNIHEIEMTFEGTKKINGREMTADDIFTFEVTEDGTDNSWTVQNDTTGKINFPTFTYGLSDIGEHKYIVKEISADGNGITADKKVYELCVTVAVEYGALTLTCDADCVSVDFTNTYEAKGEITFEGTKSIEGRDWSDTDIYSFEVCEEGRYIAEAFNDVTGKIAYPTIRYTQADVGEHTYVVRETSTDGNGITVDTNTYTVTVTVEDNGDGTLSVIASDNATALDFVNTYEAEGEVTFVGMKSIEGRALTENDVFTFVVMEGETEIATVSNDATGKIDYPTIRYTQADVGTHTYTVRETSTDGNGITVDTTEYTVTVEVADNGDGKLTVTASDNAITLNFTNKYEAEGGIVLEGMKTLVGRELKENEFSFELIDEDDNVIDTVTNDADGKFSFATLTYSEEDIQQGNERTYTYTVKEVKGDLAGVTYVENPITVQVTVTDNGDGTLTVTADKTADEITFTNTYAADGEIVLSGMKTLVGRELKADEFEFELVDAKGNVIETVENGADGSIVFSAIEYTAAGEYSYTIREVKGDLAGVTYDENEISVTVTVTDDGKGNLTATADKTADEITFTNKYEASGEITLEGMKTLVGRELKAGEFEFELIDEDGNVIEKVENGADGKFSFATLTYSEEDIQQGNEQTYTYTVKEVKGDLAGVTYVENPITVQVTVTDNGDGTLTVKADKTADEIAFTNTYAADGEIVLSGTKTLTGRALKAGEFEFELVDAKGNVIETVENGADGSIVFSAIKYTAAGEYSYTIREVKGELAGVTYDENEISVTVTVTDDGKGNLTATADKTADEITFTNKYEASGEITLEGMKTLVGRELAAGEFEFELIGEDGNVIETVENGADGSIAFSAIKYTAAGEYSYTIREVKGDLAGVTYDENEISVTVTVTDDGKGNLTATADKTADEITFTNTYAASGEITLEGMKTLVGRELKEDEFSFELIDEDGNVIETVENGADGSIVFSAIKYTAAGEYSYTIREVKGELAGVTYDENEISVTVTVTDDGKGNLTATADKEAKEITFTNTYAADGEIVLSGTKTLTGRALKADEFEFELVDAKGNVIETVENGADGSIVFSAIEYTAAGEYSYTIREVKGELKGVTYDENEISVTVTVTDDGKGNLTATADKTADEITFTNTYAADGEIVLSGTKTLTGRALKAGEFEFELIGEDGNVIETVENGADGSIVFSAIEYTAAGEYSYTIREVKGELAGVTYDENEISVTVTVTDDGKGNLTATADKEAKEITFTNTYAADGEIVLSGTKTLTGRALKADEFEFELVDAKGNVIETVENGADGSIVFSAIKYTAAGEYSYTIREVKGELAGVTYDENEINVTVTVTDDGKGNLTATADKTADEITFTNTYSATAALLLNAVKTVNGAEPTENQVFDFVLKGDGLELTAQNVKGSIEFGTIYFDLEDVGKTFRYTIEETTKSSVLMIADQRIYEVNVTVADNGDGSLKLDKVITCDGEPTNGVVFDNKQIGTLTISKKVEGIKTDETFNMVVTLYDAEGKELTGEYEYTGNVTGKITSGGTIALADSQSVTIQGLPEGATYIVEENVSGVYTTTVNGASGTKAEGTINGDAARVDFVNTMEVTTFSVTKIWDGADLGAITLTLYADGQEMVPQPEVTRAGDKYTYYDLPKYNEEGEEIVYSAKERGIEGYIRIYNNVAPYEDVTKFIHDGGTIINRAEKKVSFKIHKSWTGLDEGEIKPDITLTLYCNGEKLDVPTPKPDSNGWYKYYDLPTSVNGVPAVYTVEEEPIPGYTITYMDASGEIVETGVNGGEIINNKIPQTGDSASLGLWITLMGASAALLMVLQRRKKV